MQHLCLSALSAAGVAVWWASLGAMVDSPQQIGEQKALLSYTRQQCQYAEALMTPQPREQPWLSKAEHRWARCLVAGLGATALTAVTYGIYGLVDRVLQRGAMPVKGRGHVWHLHNAQSLNLYKTLLVGLWLASAFGGYYYLSRSGPTREPCSQLLARLVAQWPEHRFLVPPPLWPMGDRLAQRYGAQGNDIDEVVAERMSRLWVMHAMQLRLSLGPEPVQELWERVWAELEQ